MPTAHLLIAALMTFDDLVTRSVATRYAGDLERHEDPRGKCGPLYAPCDTTNIRELLVELWGERLLLDEIDRIQDALIDGLEREAWPHAWCKEDLDAEAEALAREQDRDRDLEQDRYAEKADDYLDAHGHPESTSEDDTTPF